MAKKVMDIKLDGFHLECIKTDDKTAPYRVYRTFWEHQRQIAKCTDIMHVVNFVRDLFLHGIDMASLRDNIEWSKDNGYL